MSRPCAISGRIWGNASLVPCFYKSNGIRKLFGTTNKHNKLRNRSRRAGSAPGSSRRSWKGLQRFGKGHQGETATGKAWARQRAVLNGRSRSGSSYVDFSKHGSSLHRTVSLWWSAVQLKDHVPSAQTERQGVATRPVSVLLRGWDSPAAFA